MKVHLISAGLLLALLVIASACPATDFASLLPPPKGAKVAIILFQDLEWPDCAAAYPIVREAAQAHNVPVVVYDFPLPRHSWSFQAAINARFFAEKSPKLGDDFRGYILQNQGQIADESVLRRYTEKFAADRQIGLVPEVLDPDGHLARKVKADFALGQRLGLEQTPTLFVVSTGAVSAPMVESINREKLARMIDEMQKSAPSRAAPARSRTGQRRKRS